MNKKYLLAVITIVLGLSVIEAQAEGSSRTAAIYAWTRRLFLKFGDALADQAARNAIAAGAPHEEYELSTMAHEYYDILSGVVRGERKPETMRLMWLDPETRAQNFETFTNQVIQSRSPFYYVLHNREYRCRSSGDPANSYDFTVFARTKYWLSDRVVKAQPGQEVFQHPVKYQFGLNLIAADCYDSRPPYFVTQDGGGEVARGGVLEVEPFFHNADIKYLIAWYDLSK